jgi:hypothetical protein
MREPVTGLATSTTRMAHAEHPVIRGTDGVPACRDCRPERRLGARYSQSLLCRRRAVMSLLGTPLLSCDGRAGSAHVTMGDGPCWQRLSGPGDCVQHAGIARRLGEYGDLAPVDAGGRGAPGLRASGRHPSSVPGPTILPLRSGSLSDSRTRRKAAIRCQRPLGERAIPRANAGQPQATSADAEPLFAQFKRSVSLVRPRLATRRR